MAGTRVVVEMGGVRRVVVVSALSCAEPNGMIIDKNELILGLDLGTLLSLSKTMKNAVLEVARAEQDLEDHCWLLIDSVMAHVHMGDMAEARRMLVQMASKLKNMSMQFPEPSSAHTLLNVVSEAINILKENVNVLQAPLEEVDKAGHAWRGGCAKGKPVEKSKNDRKKEPKLVLCRKGKRTSIDIERRSYKRHGRVQG